MKNFLQVNRALAAEKNFYLNLNQLPSKNDGGQSCDGNRQSRVMSQSGCSAVDVPMTSYGASDEHPMSIRSASDGERWKNRGWKYVACILMVLFMGVGQMWSADQVLKTVDFSTSAWSSATFTANATTVVDDVTASSSSSSSKPTISISSGKFTMSGNMSSGKNCVGFQVSGIQYGTLIIEVYSDASTITRCNYTVKDGGSSFSTSDAGGGTSSTAGEPIIVTGLTKTSAYVYVGRQGSDYTQFSKIIVKTPNPTGKTYAESTFYTTYASSSKTNAQLISSASFPENFLPIFAGASALNDKPTSTPTVTTPYDFSGVSTSSKSYILQTAENNVLLLNNVANVKSVRFYGDGNGSSGNISVNVTRQSGSGSTFSVSNISFTSTKTILEHSTGDLTGKSGYDANTFYNYKFTFSKKFHIWGVYVEAKVAEKDYTVTAATSTGDNTYGTVSAAASSLDEDETTTITATPATGYQVTNWAVSDGDNGASISPNGASNATSTTLTMGTANATVTATFGPKSYTVTLNNQSATTAGTENVTTTYNSNTNLTSTITKPTKTGYVFAGYFTGTNGTGIQLIDPAGNWIASAGGGSTYTDGSKNWKYDNSLTLYACWMEYCPGMDMAAQAISLGSSEHKTWTGLTTNKILYSVAGNTTFDDSSDASNAYDGLKFKNNGDYILFLVQANSSLKLYFGYTDTKPKISINGGAESTVDVSSTGSKTPNQEVDFGSETYDRLIKIRTVTSSTVVLQKIEITAVEETCPDAWSFHSKNSSSEWRDPICMELDGDGDFYISEETAINVGDVSYKVGYQGADEAKTVETDWQWMPMGPSRNWTVGAHPTASNAGGALGYFYIHSTYTDNNRYIGFFPSSYMLRQGSGESWSNTTFNPASSAYGETVWTTPVQKYTASNAADYMYTALGTGNGGAVGCAMSTAMRPIYLKLHSDWKASSPKFYIYYFKNGTDQKGWSGLMQAVPGTNGDDLVGWIPEGDWDRVNFVRFNPSDAVASWDGNVWNCTYAITIDNEKNYYVLDAQGSGGANDWYGHWDLYHNGFYRIWVDNNTLTNFALHYVPQYVLEYDNNGGSGSIDPQSVALDADPNTVTVKAATGFTAPEGKHFVNWNTAPGGGGTSYDPSDSYSLTADATLYAQWAWDTYDVSTSLTNVSVKTGTTGTGAATHGSAYTVTLQGATGYNLPTTVTVTIGGSPATLTTDYTWNSSTGVLTVLAAKVTGDISISATGVAKTTAITLEAGEGGTDGRATATYGTSTITDYEAASRTGYTLGKYQDGSKNNILTKEGELNSGDKGSILDDGLWVYDGATITLYAQWTAIEYTIAYNLAGGSVASPNPTSYTIESSVITLNNPTKTGYTFAGWTGTGLAEATTTVTIAAGSTGNRSYTATWTPIVPSSVSLNKTSTTITEGDTETLTATISPTVVADNTITWSTSDADVATVDGGVVTAVAAGTATITATTVNGKAATCEVTVEAAVTYTVTYVYNGATSGDETESATGASVTLPEPTKTGYELEGWYTTAGAKVDDGGETYSPTADITLYARWTETCSGGGGGSGETKIIGFTTATCDKNASSGGERTLSNVTNLTVAHEVVSGTTDAIAAYGSADKDGITYNNNTNLYSRGGYKWNKSTGTTLSTSNNTVGYSVTVGSGYEFTVDSISFGIAASANMVYQIIIYQGSDTLYKSTETTFTRGASATNYEFHARGLSAQTKLQDLTGTFYVRVRLAFNSTGKYLFFPMFQVIGDLHTTAGGGSSSACHKVLYHGNGAESGYIYDPAVYDDGDDPTVLGNVAANGVPFVRSGYNFLGWDEDEDVTTPTYTAASIAAGTASITNIDADVDLYAIWEEEEDETTYTVTYNGNGATSGDAPVDASSPYDAGSNVTVLGNTGELAKTNYTFDGWATANDGTGTSYAAAGTISSIAANTTLYAKWKQTVTLKTGAQGSGADQTPYVYINGTGVSSFTAHTASGYTLQGYYTAGSGGVKVLNADGTFAAANVTDYITSSKWSRTGAAPTLFAQWVASEDCRTLKYVWKVTGNFCDDQSAATTDVSMISENDYFTLSGTGYKQESGKSLNLQNTQNNYFLLTAKTGYEIKSICFYGKVQDSSVDYTTDNSTWTELESTKTDGDDYYSFNNINASHFGIKLTAATPEGIWIRNMVIEVCAAGGTTYNVTYDGNDETGGTAPTDASSPYAYGTTVTVLGNTGSLAKTNYTFAGWTTNDDGTGSSYVADNTFSITANTTLYAKWTQPVTFDANTANHGSTGGSATAVWNATGLTGITHATPASGYKLLGYYTAATEGTKVINSDGTFAETDVTDYITDGKWSRTDATTLYAQYEVAGSLTWNLVVNSDTTSLTTSSKTSSFTEILNSNMTNAALAGSLTYEGAKKSALTGKISTPASYTAADYVYVTFQVADGYKFTPSMIQVPVQPVGNGEHKAVELRLTDTSIHSLVSGSPTMCEGTEKGKKTTVTLAGNGTYFTGTVTLKIYVYPHNDATAAKYNCYRLGTPITIEGEVEEACATMPDYESMSYTTLDYTIGDTPGAISIVGGENIDTYLWKSNTTNDRSGGSAASGTNNGASYTPNISVAGTTYYWCEMTNTSCGLTIKSSAVAVTVSASKTNPTVTWDSKAKLNDSDTTAYYGGKDYTIKATLNSGWNGTLTADMMTAPAGIRLHDFTIDNSSNPKTIQATFDVQTGFDVDENDGIAFTLSLPETATYNALNSQKKVAYNVCSGGGSADEYLMPVDAAHIDNDTWKGAWVYEGTGMMCYGHGSSSISAGTKDANIKTLAHSMAGGSVTKYYKSSANHFGFYTEKAITGVRMYVYTSNTKSTVSGVYISNSPSSSSTPSTGAISYEAEYYNDDDGLLAATNDGCTWVEITFASEVAAGKYGQINVSSNVNIAGIALISGSGAGASLTTTLGFASASVNKTQSDANFTNLATTSGENANTLGAITYSSSNTSCATVNATTGEVDITATGSSELSTTITATLAASGCFKGATATYTLTVAGQSCDINAGTLAITAGEATKCASDDVTLSLSGHTTDGTTVTWYRGETNVTASVSENTLTTSEAGTYSVVVSDGSSCTVRSNAVTISNKSAEASVSKLVDQWYIKQGRLTPDVALFDVADATSWTVKKGKAATAIYTSDGTTTTTGLAGVGFKQVDNIVYLEGTAPTGIDAAANDTIIITVTDACGNSATSDSIVIHKQIATDKHVLAFVVTGTEKGGFTAGLTAEQTTELQLYKTLTKNFDVVATNIYSTDDEQKLKEYYSQFDILCITDYPNTKTKGVNSKSYVDAIGALIDIRPILTMEAWVSGLTNWKSKGISGTPHSPSTRQYSMLLQCKDHEIFAGTLLTKIGEGDETMYRVTMVDQTVEEYPTLDGYTPGSKDYNAGGKPALQGFEYTSAMSDLLPIGRIDDGAGNDLQVGIERQHEMEARLLVLGINSYAMERLKDDGEKVVVNALKYLMKKNAEDISDCSVYFDDASGDGKWNNPENWGPSYESLPLSTQEVRIYKPCIVDTVVRAASVKIIPNGKYSHGAATANGKLTIAPTGALIVDGKIYAATAPNFFEKRITEPENLVVEANSTKTGTLIFDNEDGETQATIEMYSPSHWEIDPGTGKYVKYWSYVGMPIKDVHIPDYFYGAFTYYFNEAKGWEKRFDNDIMQPFEGIGLSMQEGHKETFYGTMVSTENTDITITNHTGYGDGDNLIGNSWTAPIQIANFDEDDFGTCWATVYIFNTGKGGDTYVNATVDNDGAAKAGQWLGVPIGVAGLPEYTGLKVIPAMNAFLVHDTVSTGTTLHLDYNKLVREGADTISQINQPMRAPKQARPKKKDVDGLLRIRVVGETTNTDVWMLQDERFSERYDNGWEAYFSGGDNRSPVLYAQSAVGPMGIVALQDLDGTVLGFAPSRDGNDYTFTFYYRGDEEYYLNDLKLQQSVLIDGENNYNLTFEKGDTNRFYVSRTPFEAPQITTDVDNTSSSANQSTKAIKVIYNDKLYIIRGGRVYSADGTLVK